MHTDQELEDFTAADAEKVYEDFLKQMHRRRRDFITGTVVTSGIIGAITLVGMLLFVTYTRETALAASIIAALLYAAGSWAGYTYADEVVSVKRLEGE